MSVRTLSLVFEYDMPELKTDDGHTVPDSTAKFVLLALADHASDEGEGAYPGVKRICKKTSMSSQTVCNALNALRHNGYTILQDEKSKAGTNNYTINLEKLSQPLGFQPLESGDSNDKNPKIPAARVKPSVKPSINREAAPAFDFSNMTIPQAYKVPTLKMFNQATGWLPADILWEQVHNFITTNALTAEQIKAAAIAWIGKGYNRRNVMGILEWAKNGTTGEHQQNQPGVKPALDEKGIQETQKMLAEKMTGHFVPRPANIERPRIGKQS